MKQELIDGLSALELPENPLTSLSIISEKVT